MRAILLAVLAALTVGGCLKDHSTTTLKMDGSGTFTQVTTIEMEKAKAYVAQLKEQARGLGMPPDEASANAFAAVDARKREAEDKAKSQKGDNAMRDWSDEAKGHLSDAVSRYTVGHQSRWPMITNYLNDRVQPESSFQELEIKIAAYRFTCTEYA